MKTIKIINQSSFIIIAFIMLLASACKKENTIAPLNSSVTENADVRALKMNSEVFSPNANMFGSTYGEWSANWWKWAMELPVVPNHPFNDDPGFDVTMGQTGKVWFLAAPFGTVVRTCTIPHGKALFIALINAEASDLEGLGSTYADRLINANSTADLITNVTCTVDGISVSNINSYRVVSPEFTFNAPTPWIFGSTGGFGTSVGDGYFIMTKVLKKGNHIIHYSGEVPLYSLTLDMTYNLTIL